MTTLNINITGNASQFTSALNGATSQINHTIQIMGGLQNGTNNASNAMNHFGNVIINVNNNFNQLNHNIINNNNANNNSNGSILRMVGSYTLLAKGMQEVVQIMKDAKKAVMDSEASFRSFEMITNAKGVGVDKGEEIAKAITNRTTATMTEARELVAESLKISMDIEKIEDTVVKAMDIATMKRQNKNVSPARAVADGFKGYGQGLSSNSDNFGLEKNISVMHKEQAETLQTTVGLLNDKAKAQALVNEVNRVGADYEDANIKSKRTLSGLEDELKNKYTSTAEVLGQVFIPVLKLIDELFIELLSSTINSINAVKKWSDELGTEAAYVADVIGSVINGIKNFSTKQIVDEIKVANQAFKSSQEYFKSNDYNKLFDNQKGAVWGKDTEQYIKKQKEAEEIKIALKYKMAEEEYKLNLAKAKAEEESTKASLKVQLKELEDTNKKKLMSQTEYANKFLEIQDKLSDNTGRYLKAQLDGLNNLLGIGYKLKEDDLNVRKTKVEGDIATNDIAKTGNKFNIPHMSSGGGSGENSKDAIATAKYELEKSQLEESLNLFRAKNQAELDLNEHKFKYFKINAEEYYATIDKIRQSEFEKQKEIINKEIEEAEKRYKSTSGEANKIKVSKELATLQNKLNIEEEKNSQAITKSKLALSDYNFELERRRALSSIDLNTSLSSKSVEGKQITNDFELTTRKINNLQKLNADKQYAEEQYNIEALSIEKKRSQYAIGSDEYQKFLEQKQLLDADYNNKKMNIENQIFMEEKKNYFDLVNTTESSLISLFDALEKKPKKLQDAFKGFFDSITNNLLKLANQKLAESIMGTDGMKSIMSMMTGGGMSNSSGSSSSGGGFNFGSIINGIGSYFSSSSGGSSSSGLASGFGSLISSLASFDVGTDYIGQDMVAMVHKGEKIIPARDNSKPYTGSNGGGSAVQMTNHFTISGQVDKRTQQQLAAATYAGASDAYKRNGR